MLIRGQTCLEAYGIDLRNIHLNRNRWYRCDNEYRKRIVDAEYEVRNDYEVVPKK